MVDKKLRIDKKSQEAVYEQIRRQIARAINDGILRAGDRLPPIRGLSRELGVNQMTVARAYRMLVDERLVAGRSGAGTVVCASAPADGRDQRRSAAAARDNAADIFSRMAEFSRAPGVIAFTGGYPRAADADVAAYIAALSEVLRGDTQSLFSYDSPAGLSSLQRQFANLVGARGLVVNPESIIVTSGGQQGIDIVARSLLAHGDVVLCERPTYFAALGAFRATNARVAGISMAPDGIDVDELEALAGTLQPKLLYLIPNFSNPAGITTSLEKRRRILEVCRRYGLAVLEDDYCPELRFTGEDVPSLRSLATEDDQIFYVRGIGKVYLPGVRIGLLLAPPKYRQRVLAAKSLTDLHTSLILQQSVALYLEQNDCQRFARRLSQTYRRRQQVFFSSLRRELPNDVEISRPEGGLNLWVTLPRHVHASDLYFQAVKRGVAFAIGEAFYPDEPQRCTIRLSFGTNRDADFEEGASRLGQMVADILGVPQGAVPIVV
jgi:2-aminoadipate transaminase